MKKQQIYEIINSNPQFFLATADKDQPRVRGMFLYRADEEGIIFHTGIMKDVYRQIENNPKVELCFFDQKTGTQIRVEGELENVEDNNLKDEIANHPSRAFLKPWIESGGLKDFYKSFIVYRLKKGKAAIWTIKTNFDQKERTQL